MNNEKYNRIIEKAYQDYSLDYERDNSIGLALLVARTDGKSTYRKPDLEMFEAMIRHDKSFSKMRGVKIEERELDMMERWQMAGLTPNMTEFDYCNKLCDEHNVPTKLITITYKNETIDIYE